MESIKTALDLAIAKSKCGANLIKLKKSAPPQDTAHEECVKMICACSGELFASEDFAEAAIGYEALMVLCPTDPCYPLALAACHHRMQNFAIALKHYDTATALDPSNPVAYFHASDCFLKSDDKDGAIFMLTKAVEKAKENPEYAALLQRAELSLKQLQGQNENAN